MPISLSLNPDIIRKVIDSLTEEAEPLQEEPAGPSQPAPEPLQPTSADPSKPALSRGVVLGKASSFRDLAKEYEDEALSDPC